METLRCSTVQDIPRLRELWYLAFGDDGAYVDNFFETYYKPERMLVLEEDGVVQAMTAWFDTTFVVPEEGRFRAAYLYAVATHPDCRGKGMAGRLLAWADDYFRTLGIPAVTTVPAEPSLHHFFGANGFWECFTHTEAQTHTAALPEGEPPFVLDKLTPFHYQGMREPRCGPSGTKTWTSSRSGPCCWALWACPKTPWTPSPPVPCVTTPAGGAPRCAGA